MFLLKIMMVVAVVAGVFLQAPTVAAAPMHVPTSRDTQFENTPMEIRDFDFSDYEFVHQAGNLRFYFREDRDIFAIHDLRNGYTWTTGLDVPTGDEVDAICNALAVEERADYCPPRENRLNVIFTNMANSLLTIEFFDSSHSIQRLSSSTDNVHSELRPLGNGEFMFDVRFPRPHVEISMHIRLDEAGIHYTIESDNITGNDQHELAAILITPFLGASGGEERLFNPETNSHDILQRKELIPGYFFVPDGPGALIRFRENSTSLLSYTGVVFGENYSELEFFERTETTFVPLQNPLLPVFGAAHGYNQNAFVAFATSGAEYMEIVVNPAENVTAYTWGYPRFVMNTLYYQIFNRRGQGYFTLFEERHQYDIQISYHFLQGDGADGTPAANYFGMAKAYQAVLIEQGVLTRMEGVGGDMPIRIDFLMSDMRNTVIGRRNVVMTTPNDVSEMLTTLNEAGVTNINGGLLGATHGGITFANPGRMNFRRAIGTRSAFSNLIATATGMNIDLSFSQNYVMFSPSSVTQRNNAARHANGWYMRFNLLSTFLPERVFTFAKPTTSINWLMSQLDTQVSLGANSITIDGISNTLLSDFSRDPMTRSEAMDFIQSGMEEVANQVMVNAVTPNLYFLNYVDRFLQMPVFSSQHLIQTDTVPFLQILLSGMMEIYAPYSNFSFKDEADVLRMIDYNIMPSFVLTERPSHYLSTTNSANFYSTEFASYLDLIVDIYETVNSALREVNGSTWTNRVVAAEGVIVNSYSNGVQIIINYTENAVVVNGVRVEPLSHKVVR